MIDGKSKLRFLQGSKGAHENLCRPSGTHVYSPLYPGLTPWAKLFRRAAAGLRWIRVHRFPRNLVVTHRPKPAFLLGLSGKAEAVLLPKHLLR
jgi:hypothetical protein